MGRQRKAVSQEAGVSFCFPYSFFQNLLFNANKSHTLTSSGYEKESVGLTSESHYRLIMHNIVWKQETHENCNKQLYKSNRYEVYFLHLQKHFTCTFFYHLCMNGHYFSRVNRLYIREWNFLKFIGGFEKLYLWQERKLTLVWSGSVSLLPQLCVKYLLILFVCFLFTFTEINLAIFKTKFQDVVLPKWN